MSTSGVTLTTHGTPDPAPVTAPTPSIPAIKTREGTITKDAGDGLTGPNWVTWQVRMMSLLALCEVEPYVDCPGVGPGPCRPGSRSRNSGPGPK